MRALVAVIVCVGTAATADPWKAQRGTLAAGRAAGSYLLASDAAPGRYAEASMIATEQVALPYALSATWRRLGPEAGRSMHVLVAGGVVLIKANAIAFWAYDDASVPGADWRPIAGGYAPNAAHRVRVVQDRTHVAVELDGAMAASYPLAMSRARAVVGFGMKAAPGLRSAIYVADVRIDHLQ